MSIFSNVGVNELKKVEGLLDVNRGGEYAFIEWESYGIHVRSLFLCCPFCSHQTYTSHTLTVICEEPLTVVEPLTCPDCGVQFILKDGKVEFL
jgi:hypothetical protein